MLALLVGQLEDVVARRDRLGADLAQVAQLQMRRDLGQHVLVDEFDAHHDRRLVADVGARGRRRRAIATAATMAGRPRKVCSRLTRWLRRVRRWFGAGKSRCRRALLRPRSWSSTGLRSARTELNQCGSTLRRPSERVEQAVGRVGDEDEVMVEVGLQPLADVELDPVGVEVEADLAIGGLRIGDAFDLAQHPLAVIVQRAREQLPLGRERDLVGALRGAEHRDDDADDRDGDDHADRNHDAQARVVPAGGASSFADMRRSRSQLPVPLGFLPGTIRRNDCDWLAMQRVARVNAAATAHFRRWR